jgi:hypothetical protein
MVSQSRRQLNKHEFVFPVQRGASESNLTRMMPGTHSWSSRRKFIKAYMRLVLESLSGVPRGSVSEKVFCRHKVKTNVDGFGGRQVVPAFFGTRSA